MAISVVGTPQSGSAINGANVTLTFDGTPAVGDVVFVCCSHFGRAGGAALPTTSGYTTINDSNTTNGVHFAVAYKVLSGTPDASVTVPGTANSNDTTTACSIVLRGVHASVLGATPTTSGTSGIPDAPSITTTAANSWAVIFAGSNVSDATIGTVTGYSNQATSNGTDTNQATAALATKAVASAGAENPAAWSSWASGPYKCVTIEVLEGASGPTTISADVNSTGTSAAAFGGSALANSAVNSAGTSAAAFPGSALTNAVLNSAGFGNVSLLASAINTAVLGIAAKATVSFDGTNAASTGTVVSADFDSDGFASFSAAGVGIAAALLASVGKGAVAFNSGAVASSVLSSLGKANVAFDGGVASVIKPVDLNTNGKGNVSFNGAIVTAGVLASNGQGAVNFNSGATAKGVLNAAGTATTFFNGADASVVPSSGANRIYVVTYRRRRRGIVTG